MRAYEVMTIWRYTNLIIIAKLFSCIEIPFLDHKENQLQDISCVQQSTQAHRQATE